MDGGNRRSLVASIILVLPAIILTASPCRGAEPSEVVQAVGDRHANGDGVRQVVGKQPQVPKTRPIGLLQAFGGETKSNQKSSGHATTNHRHTQNSRPSLLSGLFGSSRSSATTQAKPTAHQHNHSPSATSRRSEPNWDGIPYHSAQATKRPTAKTPIQDPSSITGSSDRVTTSTPSTRIIRGGSAAKTIEAKPASVRRQPTLATQVAPVLAVPRPAGESTEPSRPSTLSSSSSSRRSGRRNVDALDASEIAAASRAPTQRATDSQTSDLVPKVSRREIVESSRRRDQRSNAPAGGHSPAPENKVAKLDTARPTSEPMLAPAPNQGTALAEISPPATPSAEVEPRSATDAAPTPNTILSPPQAVAGSNITAPTDRSQRIVPVPSVPSQPYAASTPSRPAAHRSGPPSDAFGPATAATPSQGSYGNQGPYSGRSPYDAVAAPVGSGVAVDGEVAIYRRPSPGQPYPYADPYQTPAEPAPYQAAPYQQPTTAYQTPYQGGPAYGPQAPGATGAVNQIATRPPPHANVAVPVNRPHDDFAASDFDSRGNGVAGESHSAVLSPGVTTVSSELPAIRVITNGPGEIMIRQTNQYEIRVENRGAVDAEGLMVRATVPDWADLRGQNATRGDVDTQTQGSIERLVWTIDRLPAGSTERMFVRVKAARSGTYGLDVDWTLVPQKSVATVRVHEPKLGLSIDGPEEVVYGQSQTYRVRVLNPGDGTASNVVFTLSPNSATPQTQRIGDIPAGKEAQFEVELTAQDLGDLKIHGLAAGDLELRAEASKTIRVAAAQLVAMLTGPELKYQNTESMYNLQIENTGTATSEKIVATLRLPVGAQYIGGIESAELRGNVLRWEIISLAPGANRNYQFRCNMSATGEHLFAFDCRGSAAGEADVSIATRVESISDLVLSISDPAAPAPIGTDVTYEIVVRNRGSKEATDVQAVAQFSHGIEPLRVEGQSGEVVTGQVLFDPIPRIGPGQEVKMRVVAQADRAGHHRFRAEVRSGDTVLVAEEATHYMSPTSERVSRRSTDSQASR
jgi:hypothetical protein